MGIACVRIVLDASYDVCIMQLRVRVHRVAVREVVGGGAPKYGGNLVLGPPTPTGYYVAWSVGLPCINPFFCYHTFSKDIFWELCVLMCILGCP